MMKPAGYYDLRQAFSEPGCALCRLLAQHADGYIEATLWELVNDIDGRAELNKARGYCNEHAWRLVRYGASLSAGILMDGVLATVLRVIEEVEFEAQPAFSLHQVWRTFNASQPNPATGKLVEALGPQIPCPVCTAVDESEKYYLAALLKHIAGSEGLGVAYQASEGLCLPHFRLALAGVSDEEIFKALVKAQRAVWQRLRAHLSEFIRKKDHRFQDENFGIEGDSWRRAIEAVSGAPPAKQVK
jgi:hypothetical protein